MKTKQSTFPKRPRESFAYNLQLEPDTWSYRVRKFIWQLIVSLGLTLASSGISLIFYLLMPSPLTKFVGILVGPVLGIATVMYMNVKREQRREKEIESIMEETKKAHPALFQELEEEMSQWFAANAVLAHKTALDKEGVSVDESKPWKAS
jgi:hypothetical protein